MNAFASGYCSRFVLRLALVGMGAGALAGCASSERLAEAFDNPFGTAATAPESTPASPSPVAAAPVKAVQSRPLSAPVAQNVAPAESSAPKIAAAAALSPAASFGGWTAQGGTPVTAARGDSAETLARRYGIPLEALVRTNGFASAAEVQPGTRLVVPVYSAALAAANGTKSIPQRIEGPLRATAAAAKSVVPQAKTAAVAPAEPKSVVAAQAPKPLSAATVGLPAARPNAPAPVKTAEVRPPQTPQPAATSARKPEPVKEQPKKVANVTKPEPVQAQALKPAPVAKVETVKPEPIKTAKVEPVIVEPKKAVQEQAPVAVQEPIAKTNIASESASPEFRWPARGRIIQGFKPGGNDGINIAVPEGTSVKAAENGIVAYAGELKGYGNLVMIRHPNGFVSAYANNGDIEVKRGDNVKRGQTIAKSGQSGDVSSPQLHFELRKGATPVDPTQYLAGL